MMKIRHALYLLTATWVLSLAQAQTLEKGGPLPGRIKVEARMEAVTKGIQISGSLSPLRIFINGQERTKELKPANCTNTPVNFNGSEIPTQGAPGIFYWEGNQTQEKNQLTISKDKDCRELAFSLPLAFFEKGFSEEVYLSDKNPPTNWPVKLKGEKAPGISIKLDQGELTDEDGHVFSHTLAPGENVVTGILTDEKGKESPLKLKFFLKISEYQKDIPGLKVKFKKSAEDELRIIGETNPGYNLFVNDQKQDVDQDGSFDLEVPLSVGENNIHLKTASVEKNLVVEEKFIRNPEVIKPWPILPEGSYFGLAPIFVHAYDSTISDFRVREAFMGKIFYGTKKWEFFFRHTDDEDYLSQGINEPAVISKRHMAIGALKLFPYAKAVHFGIGLSYGTQQRRDGEKLEDFQDLNIIGRVGWMYAFSKHWSSMSTFSPFIAIPIGEQWERFGFEFVPASLVYAF